MIPVCSRGQKEIIFDPHINVPLAPFYFFLRYPHACVFIRSGRMIRLSSSAEKAILLTVHAPLSALKDMFVKGDPVTIE